MILSYLSTDSTATDKILKFNFSFEFFKSIYVFIFAWDLIPKRTSFNAGLASNIGKYSWQVTSIDIY